MDARARGVLKFWFMRALKLSATFVASSLVMQEVERVGSSFDAAGAAETEVRRRVVSKVMVVGRYILSSFSLVMSGCKKVVSFDWLCLSE